MGFSEPILAGTPPPYGWAPAYAPPVAQQSTNGLAVASLVLGIVWIAGVGSLLALIFGIVSKRQIRDSRGRQIGSGMATAGIVLGIVGIAGAILWFVLIAVAVSQFNTCLNSPNASGCSTGNTGNFGNTGNIGNTAPPATKSTDRQPVALERSGSAGAAIGFNIHALV